jgi:protoheme IX farnesyltransferase
VFKTYYRLTKPGIIYGNLVSAVGGFLLASRWHIDAWLFVATMLGMALVIASGCVYNNYTDRRLDQKMARTRQRALVSGAVSGRSALIYATILGVAGFATLAMGTNPLTVAVGAVGLVDYVVLYGIGKRRSVYGTIVGSIAGATPVLAGYTAVRGRLDAGAAIVFLALVLWQMPHFYAIALYRRDDYAAAGLPVLPVIRGARIAKIHILVYIVGFTIAAAALTTWGYAGYTYAGIVLSLGIAWLAIGLRTFNAQDGPSWGRTMFIFSLIVMLGFSAALMVGGITP